MPTVLDRCDTRFEALLGNRRGGGRKSCISITVVNDRGRAFTFRVVPVGEGYGRERCVTADHTIVEVSDATYAGEDGFEAEGQIVSQYYLTTLAGHKGGLDLDGGVEAWKVDAKAMAQVSEFLAQA